MRDIALTLMIVGTLPFVAVSPYLGVLVFNWLSLMQPHRLAYGFAVEAPFAMVVGVLTLLGWMASRETKRYPMSPLGVLIIVWAFWIMITTATAVSPEIALVKCANTLKTLLIACLVMMLANNRERIIAMVWVIAVSVGFYGFKGGIWWIRHAGAWPVLGPEATQMADGNQLALALCMTLPLIFYLYHVVKHRILRLGVLGVGFLNVVAIFGTYSRGGLLALCAAGAFLLWKSRHRFVFAIVGAIILVTAAPLVPQKWIDRMTTIQSYDEDASAGLRFQWWKMSERIARDMPVTGGGFSVFMVPSVYPKYNPEADHPRDVHSIYFEVLGEHGYPGLLIFIALLGTAFLTASKTIFVARKHPELRWAADLARMLQVSLIGYATAGAFLTLATSHEYYQIVALIGALEVYVRQAVKAKKAGQPIEPETAGRWDWLRPPSSAKTRWRRPTPARPATQPASARQPATARLGAR
jgi:probable O-glycosylation ligase (exosortase A-associated)